MVDKITFRDYLSSISRRWEMNPVTVILIHDSWEFKGKDWAVINAMSLFSKAVNLSKYVKA